MGAGISRSKRAGSGQGQAKLSKRGSGLLRRVLYLAALRSIQLEGSAFGGNSHRLVARGLRKGSALMAVMRTMLAVAAHLLMHVQEEYDPLKWERYGQLARTAPTSGDSLAERFKICCWSARRSSFSLDQGHFRLPGAGLDKILGLLSWVPSF